MPLPHKIKNLEEPKSLTEWELRDSLQPVPPQDPAPFAERLLRSLTGSIQLRPLQIEIKGGVEF